MSNHNGKSVFAGSDDEGPLFALRWEIQSPKNEAQRTLCTVCDAAALLYSDGFERLLEQETTLEEYAAALVRVGLPQVEPIFSRVIELIPPKLRNRKNQDAMFSHVRDKFEAMKVLLYEFYDASADLFPTVARYVRAHRKEFSEYL